MRFQFLSTVVSLIALAGSASAGAVAFGVSLGQVDDFSAGLAFWAEGNPSPNAPVVLDTGLSGGDYMSNSSSGGGGRGSRMLMWNDFQWTGDYIGAGVTGISFDALSTGDQPIDFRFAFNGAGGWFTTDAIRIDDFATGLDLESFFLSIAEVDLMYVSGGTGSYADTMSAVIRLEILSASNVPGTGVDPSVLQGDAIEATLWIDNITAVPEPGSAGLLLLGMLALMKRRRG